MTDEVNDTPDFDSVIQLKCPHCNDDGIDISPESEVGEEIECVACGALVELTTKKDILDQSEVTLLLPPDVVENLGEEDYDGDSGDETDEE